jgi:paraquat-inducible protein B
VEFRGIQLGEVSAIHADIQKGATDMGLLVEVAIYPGRMEARPDVGKPTFFGKGYRDKDFRNFIDKLVSNGLRAQLRNGNLVTGQLYVVSISSPEPSRARRTGTPNRQACRPSVAVSMNCRQHCCASLTGSTSCP